MPGYKHRFLLLSVILLLAGFSFTGTGCRILKKDKQTQALKKQEEADKKAAAEYEKARKQYYNRQNKDTKKMMKKTKKKAAKFNKPLKRKSIKSPKCD
jgi:ABC-type transporter lipoprotein component MlaA